MRRVRARWLGRARKTKAVTAAPTTAPTIPEDTHFGRSPRVIVKRAELDKFEKNGIFEGGPFLKLSIPRYTRIVRAWGV